MAGERVIEEKLSLYQAQNIRDGDELRNINSYEYLKYIAGVITANLNHLENPALADQKGILNTLKKLHEFFDKDTDYDAKIAYGNMYTNFLLELEANLERDKKPLQNKYDRSKEYATKIKLNEALIKSYIIYSVRGDFLDRQIFPLEKETLKYQNSLNTLDNALNALDSVVDAIYTNPNQALERSAKMIEEVLSSGIPQTSKHIESAVRTRMMGQNGGFADKANYYILSSRDINKITPQQAGSRLGRVRANVGEFKPQTTTSMASIRKYAYQAEAGVPTEYRFGTQGQYHGTFPFNTPRSSPLFKLWLDVQERKHEKKPETHTKISHVYFNNLGRDRGNEYEGSREKKLTLELEKLEDEHNNIAVITLPADKGLMGRELLQKHTKDLEKEGVFRRLLNIVTGEHSYAEDKPGDFYISENVKKILYGDGVIYSKENEKKILEKLLEKSFEKLGLDKRDEISPAEMQAVYFHFIKFELTNYIIETLKPSSFNMTCKDAIDRGGVSSAYYNLIKSLEAKNPLTEAEFNRALHAAPTLVKGRGMNAHIQLIWNAANAYVQGTKNTPEWLSAWIDWNAPQHSNFNHSPSYYIEKLKIYETQRLEDLRNHFFNPLTLDRQTKTDAAYKLKAILENKNPKILENKDFKFSQQEWAALHNGRLGELFAEIKKADLKLFSEIKGTNLTVDFDQYKPELPKSSPRFKLRK